MPQVTYGTQPQFLNGQILDMSSRSIDSFINESLAQITTVTVAGAVAIAAEVYTITATDAEDNVFTASFTAAGGESNTVLATALRDAWNADPGAAGAAVATSAAAVITLTFVGIGRVYVITVVAPTSTLTPANTQTAGGTAIGLAVAVQYGSADAFAAASGAGMVDADVIGMTVRSEAIQTQQGNDLAVNALDEHAAGRTLAVMREGTLVALAEEAVTKGAGVFVRIANVTVVGDPLGMPRSDVDGGDAIQMLGARFGSTTTGRGLVVIEMNRP